MTVPWPNINIVVAPAAGSRLVVHPANLA